MRALVLVALVGLVGCGMFPYGCEGAQQMTMSCAAACGTAGVARVDGHGCYCRGVAPDGGAP